MDIMQPYIPHFYSCQNLPNVLFSPILHYKICLCVYVFVCVSLRNRLTSHAYYTDETYTGDAIGIE